MMCVTMFVLGTVCVTCGSRQKLCMWDICTRERRTDCEEDCVSWTTLAKCVCVLVCLFSKTFSEAMQTAVASSNVSLGRN